MKTSEQYKLVFFVPESHAEVTKAAVFAAGAGRQGDYECCAWQTVGTGQFRPVAGANPYLGQMGELEQVSEYRIETLVHHAAVPRVVAALKVAHPYEEPAFELQLLMSLDAWS
ncbi:MAG: NGG1p interacting factor NIF3 [Natronospirillum sp.]